MKVIRSIFATCWNGLTAYWGGFVKSFIWCVLTAGAGLIQIWGIWILSKAFQKTFSFNIANLLREGVLLFFSTAVVAAVTIDYHLQRPRQTGFEKLATIVFPVTMLVACMLVYGSALQNPPIDPEDFASFVTFQYYVLVMTGLYALSIKTVDLQ